LVREQLKERASLYSLQEDALRELKPDLIVTQALCEVCAVSDADVHRVVNQLPGQPRVVNLEPMSLEEVFDSIQLVGQVAEIEQNAIKVTERLRDRVERVRSRSRELSHHKSIVFLEWIDPPFCAGHWTPELIRIAGGRECLGQYGSKSRTLAWQQVVDANPDALVIACCGFDVPRTLRELPTLQSNPHFNSLPCVTEGYVYVIDGNAYFNRPGPRLVDSLEILANTLYPSLHPPPSHLDPSVRVSFSG